MKPIEIMNEVYDYIDTWFNDLERVKTGIIEEMDIETSIPLSIRATVEFVPNGAIVSNVKHFNGLDEIKEPIHGFNNHFFIPMTQALIYIKIEELEVKREREEAEDRALDIFETNQSLKLAM